MTRQARENLIMDGVKYAMNEIYLPDDPLVVVQASREEAASARCDSSACWRGYVGTWEIRDKHLYLVDLVGGKKLVKENAPAFAIWYSGIIRISLGEILRVCHSVDTYDPIYEQEIRIVVHKGVVMKKTEIDNRGKSREELLFYDGIVF